jgi:hypothetical protein
MGLGVRGGARGEWVWVSPAASVTSTEEQGSRAIPAGQQGSTERS